jgi:diaminopimelate epimerase
MNIFAIFSKRKNLLLSIENRETLTEGQTEFNTMYNTDYRFFSCHSVSTTADNFETLSAGAGTRTAAAIIASATGTAVKNRTNVYIENGSLKIA